MKVKKTYKKVYVEITNRCNLSCSFCIKNKRVPQDITISNFKLILTKLEPFTNYLYLHILGEPLLHQNIQKLIALASQKFLINITTNGYLINRIKDNNSIRQINISLHSFNPKYKITLETYLENIFQAIEQLVKNNTYISLRLWVKSPYSYEIINTINKKYNCNINLKKNTFKITDYIFIQQEDEFIWPDLNNNYYNEVGTCYGLRDHFGILVDGTIVPCCLDSTGTINLGNIYQDDLNTVLNQKRCQVMKEGFQNYKKHEEYCKHCSFLK